MTVEEMFLGGHCVILLAMLNRRTIWLLAAVMALGATYVVPSTCAERGAEVCAIVCRAERRCEQQQIGRVLEASGEAALAPVSNQYQLTHTPGYEWPASYQRPPTQIL